MKKFQAIASIFVGLGISSFAPMQAGTPLGGLTVAVSNDGSKLVAGGDTRTLLVLDPASLEVNERHWVEVAITGMAFNKDASMLAVQDSSDAVTLYSPTDWSKKVEIPKCFAFTSNGDLLAGHDGNYSGPNVSVYSFSDGAKKSTVTFDKGIKVAALALSQDGIKLAVLTEGVKDTEENEVPYAQLPKDIKGLALEEFKQKNDGKTSQLFIYDPATGNKLSEAKIYYSTNPGSLLFFAGERLMVANYTNVNAVLSPEGEVEIFQLQNSYNYGIGTSAERSTIMSGGLGGFSITQSTSLAGVTGEIDKLPSWPEYWKGFCASADSSAIYGATTAYRVFKLGSDGKVLKSEPVK